MPAHISHKFLRTAQTAALLGLVSVSVAGCVYEPYPEPGPPQPVYAPAPVAYAPQPGYYAAQPGYYAAQPCCYGGYPPYAGYDVRLGFGSGWGHYGHRHW